MPTIPLELGEEEFSARLAKHTLKDCHDTVYWNKRRGNYYAGMRQTRFHLYYCPAGSRNIFRTYLWGKIVREGDRKYIAYWYGKENIAFIRALLMAATFLYGAYLLRTAAVFVAAVFLGLGALSLLTQMVHSPKAKKQLREKLEEILDKEPSDVVAENLADN